MKKIQALFFILLLNFFYPTTAQFYPDRCNDTSDTFSLRFFDPTGSITANFGTPIRRCSGTNQLFVDNTDVKMLDFNGNLWIIPFEGLSKTSTFNTISKSTIRNLPNNFTQLYRLEELTDQYAVLANYNNNRYTVLYNIVDHTKDETVLSNPDIIDIPADYQLSVGDYYYRDRENESGSYRDKLYYNLWIKQIIDTSMMVEINLINTTRSTSQGGMYNEFKSYVQKTKLIDLQRLTKYEVNESKIISQTREFLDFDDIEDFRYDAITNTSIIIEKLSSTTLSLVIFDHSSYQELARFPIQGLFFERYHFDRETIQIQSSVEMITFDRLSQSFTNYTLDGGYSDDLLFGGGLIIEPYSSISGNIYNKYPLLKIPRFLIPIIAFMLFLKLRSSRSKKENNLGAELYR